MAADDFKPLTPKEAAFVREYLIDFNGRGAVLRAGYVQTPESAAVTASRLLDKANVQLAIQAATRAAEKRTGITLDDVIEEYAAIAFARLTDFVSWNGDGVLLVDSDKLTKKQQAMVLEVQEHPATEFGSRTFRLKLHNKLEALKALGQHLGMFSGSDDLKIRKALEHVFEQIRPRMSPEAYAQFVSAVSEELGIHQVGSTESESGSEASEVH